MSQSRQKLYNALSQQFDLGTYEQFNQKMNDSTSRRKLYDAVSQQFDLGDFTTFESKVAPTNTPPKPPQNPTITPQQKPVPQEGKSVTTAPLNPMQQMRQSVGQNIIVPQSETSPREKQPKEQPTIMGGGATLGERMQGLDRENLPQQFIPQKFEPEKEIPQPKTWQQATDVSLVEQGITPTAESFANKAKIEQQKGIGSIFKSQMQKQFETELNTLKRFEEANRLIATQYDGNLVANTGLTASQMEQMEQNILRSLQPLERINQQISDFNTRYEQGIAQAAQIQDPFQKQALIDRLEAERKTLQSNYDAVAKSAEPSLLALQQIENNVDYLQYKTARQQQQDAAQRSAALIFDPKYKDAIQDVGEIDGLMNAFTRGIKRAEIADMLAAGKTPTEEDLRKIAKLNREQQAFSQSGAMQRFIDAKGFKESAKAFLSNPIEITSQLVTESLVAQIAHGITRAGAGAMMGAGAGSIIPIGGTAMGAGLGFAAGMGVAGYNIETAASIIESLQEAGIDVNDEESLIAGFNDPEKLAAARKYANLRGVPIGVIDAVTAGIGGKISKAPIKSGAKKLAIEMGVEATGAGVGEATAQMLSTGKLDGKEIFMEMVGEVGAGAPSIAANRTAAALDVISKKAKSSAVKPESKNDAEVDVIEAMRESDLPVNQFNEIVDVHEAAGLIESEAATEVKQQYEQVQASKPVKTIEPIAIETLSGKEVKYKGKKGTLSIDEGGKITIETENQIFEVGSDGSIDANELGIREVGKQDIQVTSNETAVIDGVEYQIETDEIGNVVALTDQKTGKQALDTNTLIEVEIKRNQTVDNPFVAETIEMQPQVVSQAVIDIDPVRADAINVAVTENMTPTVDAAIDKLFDGEQLTEQEKLQVELYTTDAVERLEALKERMPEMAESVDRAINGLYAIDDLLSQSKPKKNATAKAGAKPTKAKKQVAVKANVQQPITTREDAITVQVAEQPITEPINQEQNAQEQQSEPLRTESEQGQAEIEVDSNMPSIDQADLQVGETVKEEVAKPKTESFTVGKTEYIQDGEKYFSKPSRGKQKEISKSTFDRAKAQSEKKAKSTEQAVVPSAVDKGQVSGEVTAEPDALSNVASKYGWNIKQDGDTITLTNAKGNDAAQIKMGKDGKFRITDMGGKKLADGRGGIEQAAKTSERIIKDYFFAKEQLPTDKQQTETSKQSTSAEDVSKKEEKIDIKGTQKIAEGIDMLANLLGSKKNFSPEEKPNIIKAVRLIAEGIAEELGIKGKELYQKLKERLTDSGYKSVADNLDSIASEIRDDFKDVATKPEPPKQQPPKSEPTQKEGKQATSRYAKRAALEQAENDAAVLLNDAKSKYTKDEWRSVAKKAEAFAKRLFVGEDGKPVTRRQAEDVVEFLMNWVDNTTLEKLATDGGTLWKFTLDSAIGYLWEQGHKDLELQLLQKIATTLSNLGQSIAAARGDASAVASTVDAYSIAMGAVSARLESESNDGGITNLNDVAKELARQLRLTQEEVAKLNKAIEESKAAQAVEKVVKTKQGKKAEPKPKTTTANIGKEQQKLRDMRKSLKEKWGKKMDSKLGFAFDPKNAAKERLEYAKDLIDLAVQYVRVGYENPRALMSEFIDMWTEYSGETGDQLWNTLINDSEYQQKSDEARTSWLADQITGMFEREQAGAKMPSTPTSKVLRSIADALVMQIRDRRNPNHRPNRAAKDTLSDAVELIKNKEMTARAATQALVGIKATIDAMNIPQAEKDALLRNAEDMLSAMTQDGLPTTVLRAEINNGLKDIGKSMRELAISHFSEQQAAMQGVRESLEDKLVGLGLDRADAKRYADAVEAEFESKLLEAKAKVVTNLLTPSVNTAKKNAQTAVSKLWNASSSGDRVSNTNAWLSNKGLPELTSAEVNALEDGSKSIDEVIKDRFEEGKRAESTRKFLAEREKKASTPLSDRVMKWFDRKDLDKSQEVLERGMRNFKIDLTEEIQQAWDSGSRDAFVSAIQDQINTKQLMQRFGRRQDGTKIERKKPKTDSQKMLEAVLAGAASNENTRQIFAERFGLGQLTEKDVMWLEQMFNKLNYFRDNYGDSEITQRLLNEIEDYKQGIRFETGGPYRAQATSQSMLQNMIRAVLSGFSPIVGAITIGTAVGTALYGSAYGAISYMRNPSIANIIKDLKQDDFKGVAWNDFFNVLAGNPSSFNIASRGSDSVRYDMVNGNYTNYVRNQWTEQGGYKGIFTDIKDGNIGRALKKAVFMPTLDFLELSRFTIAVDLLSKIPASRMVMVDAFARNLVLNHPDFATLKGKLPKPNHPLYPKLMEMMQKEMAYDRLAEFKATIAQEKADAVAQGIAPRKGYDQRRLMQMSIEARNEAVTNAAIETAAGFQMMNQPKNSGIAKMVEFIRNHSTISDRTALDWGKSTAGLMGLYAANYGLAILRTAVLLPRISAVIGQATLAGIPFAGMAYTGRKLQKAISKNESPIAQSSWATGLLLSSATTAYFVANILSMVDWDDEDKDAKTVEIGVDFFTKRLATADIRLKSNPKTKFYGAPYGGSNFQDPDLKITLADGTVIVNPTMSVVGDWSGRTQMRYMPVMWASTAMLAEFTKAATYNEIKKDPRTGDIILKKPRITLGSLMMAYINSTIASTVGIGINSMVETAKDMSTAFASSLESDENYSTAAKNAMEKAYTDMIYAITNPLKMATQPQSQKDFKTLSVKLVDAIDGKTGTDIFTDKEAAIVTPSNALLKNMGTWFIDGDVFNDNIKYDHNGMPLPKRMKLPETMNEWMDVVRMATSIDAKLPENFDKKYAEYLQSPLQTFNADAQIKFNYQLRTFKSNEIDAHHLNIDNINAEGRALINQYLKLTQSVELLRERRYLESIKNNPLLYNEEYKKVLKKGKEYAKEDIIQLQRRFSNEEMQKMIDRKIKTVESINKY